MKFEIVLSVCYLEFMEIILENETAICLQFVTILESNLNIQFPPQLFSSHITPFLHSRL